MKRLLLVLGLLAALATICDDTALYPVGSTGSECPAGYYLHPEPVRGVNMCYAN